MGREKSFREILKEKMGDSASKPPWNSEYSPENTQSSTVAERIHLEGFTPAGCEAISLAKGQKSYEPHRPQAIKGVPCVSQHPFEEQSQEHENPSLKGCPVAKPLLHLEHLSPLGCFAQEVFRRLGAELEFPLLYIDLKKAYRRLAHTYHPDTGTHTDPMAFHNLQDAFEILGEEFTKTQTASPLGKKAA